MSSERHGPRSTARLAEPSAHRRTPAPHAPEAPTKPPQRAKIYALTAGAACGAAEVCPRPYAVKQRETSGLVAAIAPATVGPRHPWAPVRCPVVQQLSVRTLKIGRASCRERV